VRDSPKFTIAATDRRDTGNRLITGLELYALKNNVNSSIDAIRVVYDDNTWATLGVRSAVSPRTGTKLSAMYGLGLGDPIRMMYLWYDRLGSTVTGVSITTRNGKQMLQASGDLFIEDADVSLEDSDVGSGVLAAVAAVTYVPPNTGNVPKLVAVNFAFVQQPMSVAVTVDMPDIPIESIVNSPFKLLGSSATTVQGTSADVTCPYYEKEEPVKHYYGRSSRARDTHAVFLRSGILQQQFSFSTSMQWQGSGRNPVDQKAYNLGWTGSVENIFSSGLTPQDGNATIKIRGGAGWECPT